MPPVGDQRGCEEEEGSRTADGQAVEGVRVRYDEKRRDGEGGG
jgi:hypothetical protein